MYRFLFLLIAFFILSFGLPNDVQKKLIRTKKYDIQCYVSLKEKQTQKGKLYFWFNGGEIHQSFGDASGQLLHLDYEAFYRNNQLAEKGEFNFGLKKGVWKKWHENGALQQVVKWYNGEKSGFYYEYNNKGEKVLSGRYINNLKSGIWVNHKENDTIWYVKGKSFLEDPKIIQKRLDSINGKEPILKRLFKKRDSTKVKENSFFRKLFKSKKDTLDKSSRLPFFKRLFKIKEKAQSTNF